ncbi:hypothetical protein [Amycolatopsis sp. FDAARGOS 1241]|nr:hypothetical protein [Amycolatopsis sp. FDAARGOS 1241]
MRERFGFPCPHAAAQLADLERRAAHFAAGEGARVVVEAFEK